MAIGPIVTRGFGSFGSVNLVVTRGYTPGEPAPEPVTPPSTGGDDAWIRKRVKEHRDRLKRWDEDEEKRYREEQEARERLSEELKAIYDRVVNGVEITQSSELTEAVADAVAPHAPPSAPDLPPSRMIDWAGLLDSAESIRALLRAYGETDKTARRERKRMRNNAIAALLLADG